MGPLHFYKPSGRRRLFVPWGSWSLFSHLPPKQGSGSWGGCGVKVEHPWAEQSWKSRINSGATQASLAWRQCNLIPKNLFRLTTEVDEKSVREAVNTTVAWSAFSKLSLKKGNFTVQNDECHFSKAQKKTSNCWSCPISLAFEQMPLGKTVSFFSHHHVFGKEWERSSVLSDGHVFKWQVNTERIVNTWKV